MIAYPWRRKLWMPDATGGVGITSAAVLYGQPGCDCCGSTLPCVTPACLVIPGFPCFAGRDYSIEIVGPAPSTAVVYSGPVCDIPTGPLTPPCYGGPTLEYAGVYSWSIWGYPSGYTPSATSGTFTATCGGFAGPSLTWSFADPGYYCPCGPGTACDNEAFPPVATTGTRTLTNRFGAVTLSPYPASSPLVVHGISSSDTFADVWAGTQTVTACSVASTCCDTRLIGGGGDYPGTATILWVFGCKSSGADSLCGLRAYTMGCYCSGLSGIMFSAGSFDNSGTYTAVDCENTLGVCTRAPVAIPLVNGSPSSSSTASPFLYSFGSVLARIASATLGKPIPSYLGSCDPYATGTGYADYYIGDTTVTL